MTPIPAKSGLAAMPIHPAGIAVIIGMLIYGMLSLAALAVGTRFKHFGTRAWVGSAAIAGALNLAWNGLVLRSFTFEPFINAAVATLAIASCFAFVFLARSIADGLLRAGVLHGTPLGRDMARILDV
jgi:hypothetical protein